mmetsp:Transcript_2701/g.8312  ORF Transcript_2701/g.8312 Transcript_2701/m.8312 type:complete len:263 (+) Transcript_2701:681-1469(+)
MFEAKVLRSGREHALSLILDDSVADLGHLCAVHLLAHLRLPRLLERGAPLLEQRLNLATMLHLALTALLRIELVDPVVLGEFLHHRRAEGVLLLLLVLARDRLELALVLVGERHLEPLPHRALHALPVLRNLLLLCLAREQLVAQVLHLLLFGGLTRHALGHRLERLVARVLRLLLCEARLGLPLHDSERILANLLVLSFELRDTLRLEALLRLDELGDVGARLCLLGGARLRLRLFFLQNLVDHLINHRLLFEELLVCLAL